MPYLDDLLYNMDEAGASDLHLVVDQPPKWLTSACRQASLRTSQVRANSGTALRKRAVNSLSALPMVKASFRPRCFPLEEQRDSG